MLVAPKNSSWSKACLGQYADLRGVYVHHSNNEILYIGQTVKGKWGTFGERLRREFQETSSQSSRLYKFLAGQKGQVKTTCFNLEEINTLVGDPSNRLSSENKALIFEQVLIGIHQPEGNKNGVLKKIEKEGNASAEIV